MRKYLNLFICFAFFCKGSCYECILFSMLDVCMSFTESRAVFVAWAQMCGT
jgi:hypothetical protein